MNPKTKRITQIEIPAIRTNFGYQGFEDDSGNTASTLSTPARIAGVRLSGCFMACSTATGRGFRPPSPVDIRELAAAIGRRKAQRPQYLNPILKCLGIFDGPLVHSKTEGRVHFEHGFDGRRVEDGQGERWLAMTFQHSRLP
jgi:hypothetical protein